jgi:hypothetical protein
MIYFSKTAKGFFDSDVHGDNLPVDAHELEVDVYTDLLAKQAQGLRIDWSGAVPVAVDASAADAWLILQAAARRAIEGSDLVAIRCIKAGKAYPAAWNDYDAALRQIISTSSGDATQGLPPQPAYP